MRHLCGNREWHLRSQAALLAFEGDGRLYASYGVLLGLDADVYARGKRRNINADHKDGEAMARVGIRLIGQLVGLWGVKIAHSLAPRFQAVHKSR